MAKVLLHFEVFGSSLVFNQWGNKKFMLSRAIGLPGLMIRKIDLVCFDESFKNTHFKDHDSNCTLKKEEPYFSLLSFLN